MIKNLIRLANNLDSKGLRAEADTLDSIIQKWAGSNNEDSFPYNGDSETAGVRHEFLIEAAKTYALSNNLDSGNLDNRKDIHNWLMTSFGISNGQAELAIRGEEW